MRLCRYPIVYLCALWAFTLGACAGEDEATTAEDTLRQRFPEQAATILGPAAFGEGAARIAANKEGLGSGGARRRGGEGASELDVRFPSRGDSAVRIGGPRGSSIRVREVGAYGDVEPAGVAMTYARPSGASFWTPTDGGYEEWLLLEAGVAFGDRPIAAWEVEGATLRQAGELVEVLDAEGVPVLRVAAPAAFASGGREVATTLVARGETRLELSADADGEEVLVDPSWTPTSMMITPRQDHITALLPSGKALVAGGTGVGVKGPTAACEIYDPLSDVWTATGPMIQARDPDSFATLQDGRIFVAGGDAGVLGATATAETYNPSTGTWAATTPMSTPRRSAALTRLASGKVLVTGGVNQGGFLASAELFDPATNKWSAAAPMGGPRAGHRATLLKNGKVLVTGGASSAASGALSAAEVYDPTSNTWSSIAPLATPRMLHRAAALTNGKVLVVDAAAADLGANNEGNAELYDPASGAWAPGGHTIFGGESTALIPLESGKVLRVVFTFEDETSLAEIYDPEVNEWTAAKPLSEERRYASAALLSSGKVLITGGAVAPGAILIPFAEVYDPGEGRGAPCAAADDCESGFCADGVCCDTACDAGPCEACSIKAGALSNGTCGPRAGACDDGNPCTRDEVCKDGVCKGAPIACAPIDDCHEAGSCEPSTGQCSQPPRVDGSACSEGVCEAGRCSLEEGLPPEPTISGVVDPAGAGAGCSCRMSASNQDAAPLLAALALLIARRGRAARRSQRRRRGSRV